MAVRRREVLFATAGAGLAVSAPATAHTQHRSAHTIEISPSGKGDDTPRLQVALNEAAALNRPLLLAPGHYDVRGTLQLLPATKLIGPHGLATLQLGKHGFITADGTQDLALTGLKIVGTSGPIPTTDQALVSLNNCANLQISNVTMLTASGDALRLWRCSGRVHNCNFENIGNTAIRSGNARDLDISHNTITHAGNNGIVVWRDKAAADATSITNNHIEHIRTDSGGTGQNGNAINAFRADNVIIQGNTLSHCAYSAVRCNAASNAQIVTNNCRKIGEVALYAEFAFEGAVIANNIVDGAATGIEVTNFKEGGRLATVQGNVIRNLFRREHEPVDKRGIGIAVEADTIVNANTIENAPTAGIMIGWGRWIRNVIATSNVIRQADIGIAISSDSKRETVVVSDNIITDNRNGSIRLLDHNKPIGAALTNRESSRTPGIIRGNILS